jgi:hypothetical protein
LRSQTEFGNEEKKGPGFHRARAFIGSSRAARRAGR